MLILAASFLLATIIHAVALPILSGCACRFLYGPETKDEHKGQIEKSLDGKLELKLEVIFYKKNGECAAHFGVILFGQQQLLIGSVEFLNWNVVNDLLSL